MRRKCEACPREYEAKRKTSRFCSDACRSNNRYAKSRVGSGDDSPLVGATRAELEAAGKLDTMLGQQALTLAARMSSDLTGAAALSRELRAVMAAALGVAPSGVAAGQGDTVDELRARRNAKRAG